MPEIIFNNWTRSRGIFVAEASDMKGQTPVCGYAPCQKPLPRKGEAFKREGEILHWDVVCPECSAIHRIFND